MAREATTPGAFVPSGEIACVDDAAGIPDGSPEEAAGAGQGSSTLMALDGEDSKSAAGGVLAEASNGHGTLGCQDVPSGVAPHTSEIVTSTSKCSSLGNVTSALSSRSDIRELIFTDPEDEVLFRGTTSSEVLRQRCLVMSAQESDREPWEHSSPVDHVRTFISHNWSTSRLGKFLVLILYFNALPSVVVGVLASVACFALVVAGYLPTFAEAVDTHLSCWCITAYTTMFFASLAYFHDVSRLFGFRGSSCFLDKCCVNQKNSDLKSRAIKNLSGFMYYSWDVLIVYTDIYLQKLWTVYEVASFLTLHHKGYVCARPEKLAKIVIGMICIIYWGWMLEFLLVFLHFVTGMIIPEILVFAVVLLIIMVVAVVAMPLAHAWACEQASIQGRVDNFTLAGSKCFDEEDRAVVTRDIVKFMKFFKYVGDNSTPGEAIARFEELVREEVPQILTSSFGRAGMQYSMAVLVGTPTFGWMLDSIAAAITDGRATWNLLLSIVLKFTGHIICTVPLTLAFGLFVGRCTCALQRRGWNYYVLWPASSMVLVVVGVALDVLETILAEMATQDAVWLAAQACTTCVLLFATLACYRMPPRKRYRRRLGQ